MKTILAALAIAASTTAGNADNILQDDRFRFAILAIAHTNECTNTPGKFPNALLEIISNVGHDHGLSSEDASKIAGREAGMLVRFMFDQGGERPIICAAFQLKMQQLYNKYR